MFFIITFSTSLIKKRENMPYILLGQIFGERYALQRHSATATGLNICADTNIKSSFGRLVPLGSVESLIVAIIS